MEKRLCEDEKMSMEKGIEWQLGNKAKNLINPEVSDEKFFEALRDICILNLMRDEINK